MTWNSILKHIGSLLPVSETQHGRGLTKKETLVHMVQYIDFLQSHIQSLQIRLPEHCLTDVTDRNAVQSFTKESDVEDVSHAEPWTPPCALRSKRRYSCGRSRKKETLHPEWTNGKTLSQCEEGAELNAAMCPSDENSSLPSSYDSICSICPVLPTTSSSRTGSSADQESPFEGAESQCSICDERTGSEGGSQESKVYVSPPSGSFLLRDRMLGVLLPSGIKPCESPTLPHTPRMPFLSLLGVKDGLNLSPSLLTSPARGLNHHLLPDGQEELQTLFEDVWVTPKSMFPRVPGWTGQILHQRNDTVWDFSRSEEDDRGSDDVNWTPKQRPPVKKASKTRCRRAKEPSLKKKCVNGFIMFCRMNRKLYLRTHPGLPSSVVTKELASLWRVMPKHERRVYCLKARHFSRENNRNVRSGSQEVDEEAKNCTPSPLHMLLAHRNVWCASAGQL